MPRFIQSFAVIGTVLAFSAQAQASGTLIRTFVSSTGVDSNPCTITAPCASFAAAYAAVAPNGVIAALDPGKYGPLTITSSVTVDGNGWSAITSPASGNGIVVTAGAGNVVLRGITVDGAAATGTQGILYISGASLTIDGCVVRNMKAGGLIVGTSAESALTVTNSSFENNGTGVQIQPSAGGSVFAAFDATQITGNSVNGGLLLADSAGAGVIHVAVTNSVISNNTAGGVSVASSQSVTNLYLTHVQVTNNPTFGVLSTGTEATVWIGQTTITGNPTQGYGVGTGSAINSFDDNYIADNGPNSGTLGTAIKQ
jgi:hypothetical protein